jgi:carboxylesterase type B
MELPYVFRYWNGMEAADQALSALISGMWSRFARTGSPADTALWPAYTLEEPVTFVFDLIPHREKNLRSLKCDLFDTMEASAPSGGVQDKFARLVQEAARVLAVSSPQRL